MKVVPFALGLLAIAFVGCGGSTKTVTETAAPSEGAKESGASNGYRDEEVPASLVKEWPSRWCEIKIGDSRKEAVRVMGAYPTEEDSQKIPLIPYVHFNEQGENTNHAPPEPAGSDTWEEPGSYQFNAFYNPSLHVQQLDFNGPSSKLPCSPSRIR